MKLSLVILVALSISAYAGPIEVSQRNLHDDLEEFVALIPGEKIKHAFWGYIYHDSHLDYIVSDEFTSLLYEVETMPEVSEFLDHLEELGAPARKYVSMLNAEIAMEPVYRFAKTGLDPPGLKGFFEVSFKMIPHKKIEALYKHKLETSMEFMELVDYLNSPASQEFVDKLMKHPKVQKFMALAEEHGVNIQEALDYLSSMFEVMFPQRLQEHSKDLLRDLEEFFHLFPYEAAKMLVNYYTKKDAAFHQAVNWIKSDKWSHHMTTVQGLKEFNDILEYLEKNISLPAYDFVNRFNEKLGLPSLHPVESEVLESKSSLKNEDWGGVSGFLEYLRILLPHDAIHDLYTHKMQTSLPYKYFVQELNRPDAAVLFRNLVNHEHFQAFAQEAQQYGINYHEVVNLVKYAFGINYYNQI